MLLIVEKLIFHSITHYKKIVFLIYVMQIVYWVKSPQYWGSDYISTLHKSKSKCHRRLDGFHIWNSLWEYYRRERKAVLFCPSAQKSISRDHPIKAGAYIIRPGKPSVLSMVKKNHHTMKFLQFNQRRRRVLASDELSQ